ncbi:MAG TPA: ATP-binding protein [Saprospiraceae bacterium]|nr:ATP-binding protein [Saprospiraceae bacterium]
MILVSYDFALSAGFSVGILIFPLQSNFHKRLNDKIFRTFEFICDYNKLMRIPKPKTYYLLGVLLLFSLTAAMAQPSRDTTQFAYWQQQVMTLRDSIVLFDPPPTELTDTFWHYFHFLEKDCEQHPDPLCTIALARAAWSVLDMQARYQEAGEWGKRGLEVALRLENPKEINRFYRLIGIAYDHAANIEESLRYFMLGLQRARHDKYSTGEAAIFIHLGYFYEYYGSDSMSLQKAHDLYQKALDIAASLGDSSIIATSAFNLALTETDPARAIHLFEYATRHDSAASGSYYDVEKAKLFFKTGRDEEAVVLLQQIIAKEQGLYLTNARKLARYELAAYYLRIGDPRTALPYAEAAAADLAVSYRGIAYANVLKLLADIHAALGQYRQAQQYLLDYQDITERLDYRRGELYHHLNTLQYELEQQEAETERLRIQAVKKRRLFFLLPRGISALFLLSIVSLALLLRMSKLKQKRNAELEVLNKLISEQKEALSLKNSELTNALEKESLLSKQLQRSNSELSNFAHTISHDLKEPLRTLGSFGQLLQRRFHQNMDAEMKKYIEYIVAGAHRMTHLITDLLRYSEISFDERQFEPVDLNRIIREVEQNLRPRIVETGATIHCEHLPTVRAIPVHMLQVLQNLVSNAIKYRRPGVMPVVHIQFRITAKTMEIAIKDNGIGIQEAFQPLVFKLFARFNGQEPDSAGVGLAICKKIVENYNGQIRVESTPDLGSTFFITWPLSMLQYTGSHEPDLKSAAH